MVAILRDTAYSQSLWGQKLYQSLVERLRQKRIPFCDITDTCPADCDGVFVIATDPNWTRQVIRQLNAAGRRPILLCNQTEPIGGCVYSAVCSDINTSMKNVLDTLKAQKKTRVALYGVNFRSLSDISRINTLFAWREDAFDAMEIFENEGSLSQCFDAFYPRVTAFDAVICANDFAALSLVKRLEQKDPAALQNLTVISCAETHIAAAYRKYITTLHIHFELYGKAAVYIYESLGKRPYLTGMTVNVAWDLENGTAQQTVTETAISLPTAEDAFYADPELRAMMIAEKVLGVADDTDRVILQNLLLGKGYTEVADACFLAESSVKYRVKRLIAGSGAADKAELLQALQTYGGCN